MKKNFLRIFVCLVLCILSVDASAQFVNNKKFYTLEQFGNARASVRVMSDYTALQKNAEFTLVYHFSISYPWYMYSEAPSDSHKPLTIEMELPEGVEIVEKIVPKGEMKDGSELFNSDFDIIYRMKTTGALAASSTITATMGWQCCDGNLCTMGNVKPVITLPEGQMKKSAFYKGIRSLLK